METEEEVSNRTGQQTKTQKRKIRKQGRNEGRSRIHRPERKTGREK